MSIAYNIDKFIDGDRFIVKFSFVMPAVSIKNALTFRINNSVNVNGTKKSDPWFEDSLHMKQFVGYDIGKNVEAHFHFNLKNIAEISSLTFGLCDELIAWHKHTFITVECPHNGNVLHKTSTLQTNTTSTPVTATTTNYAPQLIVDSNIKKICMLSTWNIKCGISQYCKNLYNSLLSQNCEVSVVDHKTEYNDIYYLITKFNFNIFIVQYEPGLIKDVNQLLQCIKNIKANRGVKVYFIIHSEHKDLHKFDGIINGFIYHKNNKLVFNNTVCYTIPMGVPIFKPEGSKEAYRNKYGIGPEKFVISTVGFMFKWKKHADFLSNMIRHLREHNDIVIQMMTSFHSLNAECVGERDKVLDIINTNRLHDKVIHITDYIPQAELNERLYLSDLGFLYAGIETTSSSASLKEFVSSRLPVVKTDSTHHHDITAGSITTSKDMSTFTNKIIEVYKNRSNLNELSEQMNNYYNEINYDKVALKFMDIFNG